jgi:hypothetical protein
MESQEDKQSQEQEIIVAASGKPFKTEKAAQSAIKQKGLDPNKCDIIEQKNGLDVGVGYGIVVQSSEPDVIKPGIREVESTNQPTNQPNQPTNLTNQPKGHVVKDETFYDGEVVLQTIYKAPGKPFLSPKEAKDFMTKRHINSGTNRIIKVDENAFAIYGDGQIAPIQTKEKYFRVSFQARADKNDPEDVMLSVNGETLVIQREKEVIIPARFRECADHALIIQFKQLPDQPRKLEAPIKSYPYSLIGEATEAEYLKQKAEGDRKTRHNVKKYGFNVTPEMIDG